MVSIGQLKTRLFCDAANLDDIRRMSKDSLIKGFTTNPTLMRKAGVTDYESFGREVLSIVPDRPVSFEVFADETASMEKQARKIASWASNVNVKIPVTNTKGESTSELIYRLSHDGIVLNVTAILTLDQVEEVSSALSTKTPAIISVFAGRIADTGVDPVPLMRQALEMMQSRPHAELLWASPRELLNVFQAHEIGCHIITATPDILAKLKLVGKSLKEYSLETVKMFYSDAAAAGFSIRVDDLDDFSCNRNHAREIQPAAD